MRARYYRAHGPELIVELWDEGKSFTRELCYEAVSCVSPQISAA